MVKRPFIYVLSAFMAGGILTKFSELQALVLISALFLILFLLFFVLKVNNSYFNSLDRFLILLPLVMYWGMVLMNKQQATNPMDFLFDDKIEVKAEGQVYQIISKANTTAVYLKDCKVEFSEKTYRCGKLLLYVDAAEQLKIGNKISAVGKMSKFIKPGNLGQFNEWAYYKTLRIDYKIFVKQYRIKDNSYDPLDHRLFQLRQRITQVYQNLLNEKEAGLISAMLLGEKSLLEEDINALYQRNGASHLLVISGIHIHFIGTLIFGLLRLARMNHLAASSITTIFLYCYGLMTGFGVSTNRAVVMMVIGLFAKVIGRTYDVLTALAISALLILVQSPMQIYNAGFLLSYGAVIGIAFVADAFRQFMEAQWDLKGLKLINGFVLSFNISFSVNLVTFPIILYYFYEVPLYSVFLNILIVPLSSLLILLPILGALGGSIHLLAGRFLIGGASFILKVYEALCKFFENLPESVQIMGKPTILQLSIYYMLLLIGLYLIKKYKDKKYLLFVCLLFGIIIVRPPQRDLEITFLDVGQGDGIFIRTPTNTTYLIDGGSSDVSGVGKYRIITFLKAKGIRKVDYAIMTHTDKDHISGLVELIESSRQKNGIAIEHLVLPHIEAIDEVYISLVQLAEKQGIKVVYIEKGDVLKDGRMRITCLHPYLDFMPESKNAYSTVLSLEYGAFKALFTGDLEGEGEIEVLHSPYLLDYNILKVAHHGSKNSTSQEFLEKIKPEIAVISCGKGNSYGHPSVELVERLKEAGSQIYNTVYSGAITVLTDGKKIRIKVFLEKNPLSE